MLHDNPVDRQLRKNFPGVYLTMLSIVVALAAEGLLARLDEVEALFEISGANFLVWSQSSLVLLLAALFWWVTVRWVVSFPWRFGFSDAIGPLGMLLAFRVLVTAVGTGAGRWFGALGLIAVGGSIIYLVNARRGISLSGVASALSRTAFLIPTSIGVATGMAALVFGALGAGRSLSVAMQLLGNALVAAGIVAFAVTEHRVWRRLADLVPRS